jgi:hypothetical protein
VVELAQDLTLVLDLRDLLQSLNVLLVDDLDGVKLRGCLVEGLVHFAELTLTHLLHEGVVCFLVEANFVGPYRRRIREGWPSYSPLRNIEWGKTHGLAG